MGIFDWFKQSRSGSRNRPAVVLRTVMNLQINDIVTYDLEDYIVAGKIGYNDSGYRWTAYHLKGETQSVWLAAEMDDELEIGIYKRVLTNAPASIGNKLDLEGKTYYLEEHGYANITEAAGQAGAVRGQQIEYWDLESEDGEFLSVEKWGSDLEMSRGYTITEKEIKIIAGS